MSKHIDNLVLVLLAGILIGGVAALAGVLLGHHHRADPVCPAAVASPPADDRPR